MAGWRIATMVGNERMIGALAHMKTYLDYGTFAPLQYAAAWALDNGEQFADGFRELYRGRAHALVAGLTRAGWPSLDEPRGTMFVWAPIPERYRGLGSIGFTTKLIEEAHVATSPGIGFRAGWGRARPLRAHRGSAAPGRGLRADPEVSRELRTPVGRGPTAPGVVKSGPYAGSVWVWLARLPRARSGVRR